MNNTLVRALSGIVYIALIVGAALLGGWWMTGLLTIFAVLALIEFQNAKQEPNGSVAAWEGRVVDIIFGAALVLSAQWGLFGTLVAAAAIALLYPAIRLTVSLYDNSPLAFQSAAMSVLSVIYIALPLTAVNLLEDICGAREVLLIFVLIWLNDTGAFCFGCTLGKHKLFERLSPKKSWEGFWGGFACTVIAAGLYAVLFQNTGLTLVEGMGFGAVVSVLSTWGDLFESLLKRSSGVKDSGHLIPGHGGILDRIDSLLFVAPVALFFLGQF